MRFLKIQKVIFLSFLFFYTQLQAQEGWYPLNKVAKGNSLKSVFFINDSTGFTVSDEGLLLFTNDYGNSWNSLQLADCSLNDIFFYDSVGIVVGDKGKIFKTMNGDEWKELQSGTEENLNAVYLLDSDTGYVFGNNSTILKTTNGGESWEKLNLNSNLTITDGVFPAPNFGFCTTLEGYLMRTLDYGKTWGYLAFPETYSFFKVAFLDTNTAYIAGFEFDIGLVLKTTDGGNSFTHLYPNIFFVTDLFFLNKDVGFVTGDRGILKTTDGGASWSKPFVETNRLLNSVYFVNSSLGYVVGNDSTILRTTDGGESWKLIGSGFTTEFYSVFFPQKEKGFAVGGNGEVYTIENDVPTLIYRESSIYNSFRFVYFIDPQKGFMGGSNGKFFTTTDAGKSWSLTDFRPQGVINMPSISFFQNRLGIVSANSKIIRTTDGGTSWNVIDANTSSFDVFFLNEDTLVSVGLWGAIYKSYDGGLSWIKVVSPTDQSLNSVSFVDDKTGFAVGFLGTVIKTTDAGNSWNLFDWNDEEILWRIKFVNGQRGYIVGNKGRIFFSSDGGENWSVQKSGTTENLQDIFFVDDTTAYVVGMGGTLLKTTNGGVSEVKRLKMLPNEFQLYQNYPNPFNPATIIRFQLPTASQVTLSVYNVLGKLVSTLVDAYLPRGIYEKEFNASHLSSGIYFYKLETKDFTSVKKMILIK